MWQFPEGWKNAPLVKVAVNTMSFSKALVFKDCSKPQTNLKTIIGTGTRDWLHRARWATVGVISYSPLGHGAPPFLKTQSQRGTNYWFSYSDQLASLSFLALWRPTITLKGILQGKKTVSTQASPSACTSSVKPSSLRQTQEVKWQKGPNAYLMSPVTWLILDMMTWKSRHACRFENTRPVI